MRFKTVLADVKSDLIRTTVVTIILSVVASAQAIMSEGIYTEYKQPFFIVLLFILFFFVMLFVNLVVRSHLFLVKLGSVIIIGLIFVISYFAFLNYTYKGLQHNRSEYIFIVFYPDNVSSPSLKRSIENGMRELPRRLIGLENTYRIKKIALPASFNFDHSLLKEYVDQSPYVISYVQVIPDGKQAFLKLGFPSAVPYYRMGFKIVENISYEDQELHVKFQGRTDNYNISLELLTKISPIHYGIDDMELKIGISQSSILLRRSEHVKSLLSPAGNGLIVNHNNISGSVYFALTSGL